MSRVHWIKLDTDFYKNEKLMLARDMAEDDIGPILVWVALLALAGKRNEKGRLMITDKMAYTPAMLAREFMLPLELIKKSLDIFIKLRMVLSENGVYRIRDWESHQNLEQMERAQESNRQRQARYRAKKKAKAAEQMLAAEPAPEPPEEAPVTCPDELKLFPDDRPNKSDGATLFSRSPTGALHQTVICKLDDVI